MIDITGQKFNRLTAIEPCYCKKGKGWYWKFKCDCGNEKVMFLSAVKNGYSKSCGCLTREVASVRGKSNTKHGLSKHPLYKKWRGIKQRCFLKSRDGYENYGGRGITMCDEWLGKNGFYNFYNWAIQNGYKKGLTIDRIDVNGNYEPTNCRWVTMKTQGNNRRNNKLIEYKGTTHTIAEWADIIGVNRSNIHNRLHNGWTIEEALTIPKGERRVTYKNGTNRG